MTPDLPDRSRWTDLPFSVVRDASGRIVERAGLPELTDAQIETIEARNLAWWVYNDDRRRQRAAPARSPAVAGRGGRVSAGIARSADTAAPKGRLNPKPLKHPHARRKAKRPLPVLRPRYLAGHGVSAGFWPEPPDSR